MSAPAPPERVGEFYLGGEVAAGTEAAANPLLYDAADLTTHAVIIGMTGSGKTGLGVALLEEAALDGIPVVAIDPKGDLANLALAFPDPTAADLEPWIDPRAAAQEGLDANAKAALEAAAWRDGLASWGQDAARVRRLNEAREVVVFTPGSTAGQPLNVLRSLAAPGPALRRDPEALDERVQGTVDGLLGLTGESGDPLTSPEHLLLSTLLHTQWAAGRDLSLADLVALVHAPPFDRIGVLGVDAVMPATDRAAFARKLNALLAAPSFATWLSGTPLSAPSLLMSPDGRPRTSVITTSHLNDGERMFAATLVLNEMITWMRAQPGSGTLRAIVYLDEVFGYLPPTANPPSKRPLLTLLKQARAFGIGVVLGTQNPVDLDYKALSNAGTWFLGRLQTEQDRERVLSGLSRADAGSGPSARELSATLAGLGKRTFLLHSVHEPAPRLMTTRWVMSYLAGPLARPQLERLMRDHPVRSEDAPDAPATPGAEGPAGGAEAGAGTTAKPILAGDVPEFFAPLRAAGDARVVWRPRVLAAAGLAWDRKRPPVRHRSEVVRVTAVPGGAARIDWGAGDDVPLELADLDDDPPEGACFDGADLPAALDGAAIGDFEDAFVRYLRAERGLALFEHPPTGLISEPGEREADFRERAASRERERRDVEKEELRRKTAARVRAVANRVARAERAVTQQQAQARKRTFDTAVRVGTALLGGFLNRRAPSASSIGTTLRSAGSVGKETSDVAEAERVLALAQRELDALQADLAADLAALATPSPAELAIEPLTLALTRSHVAPHLTAIVWLPFVRDGEGAWTGAF